MSACWCWGWQQQWGEEEGEFDLEPMSSFAKTCAACKTVKVTALLGMTDRQTEHFELAVGAGFSEALGFELNSSQLQISVKSKGYFHAYSNCNFLINFVCRSAKCRTFIFCFFMFWAVKCYPFLIFLLIICMNSTAFHCMLHIQPIQL
jgi:hypothetical protein